jgi:hypothetical protein
MIAPDFLQISGFYRKNYEQPRHSTYLKNGICLGLNISSKLTRLRVTFRVKSFGALNCFFFLDRHRLMTTLIDISYL